MNAKLLIVACSSLAQVVSSDASTRAWWHFNGADGASASSPLMDYNGAFGLQLRKQGTATAGMVTYISPTTGVLPYVGSGDTPDVLPEPVAGGIRFFIPSPATASLGRSEMVGAYLLADATKSLFNYDNTGMFPEFTIEMFVRADPYDQTVNDDAAVAGDQRGGGLFSIKRLAIDNTGNNVLTLEFVNSGSVQLRGDSSASANADRVYGISSTMTSALRDGQWHRVAVVYSLENGNGRFKVYCDETCYMDVLVQSVPGLTTADTSGEYRSAYFSIGDVAGRHVSLYVDEVRISDKALSPEEFLRIGERSSVSFLYPFGNYPANKEFSGAGVTATGTAMEQRKTEMSLNIKANGCSYPCAWKYNFTGSSSFSVPSDDAAVLSLGAFTLETCFQTASTASQTIFAHGSLWSLMVDNGQIVWNRSGESPRQLGGAVADGAWHQLALVYMPPEQTSDARYDIYLDGATLGSVTDQAALPKMYKQPLVLGDGFVGSMLGFRLTPQALPLWKFERLSVVTGDRVLAAWPLDVDCSAGEVPLTSTVGRLREVHGNPFYELTPGTYTSVTFNSGNTQEFGGDYLPVAVSDVYARQIWRADTKRILSAENLSSVRFRNACTANGSTQWNNNRTGGRLFSVSQGNACGLKFTAEMFVKAERQFVNNYSLLINQVSEGSKGRTWMLDAFQNRKLRLSDTTVTDRDVLGDGGWHHVALTYDAETNPTQISYGIYVDHEEVSSGVCSVGSTIDPFNGGGTFNFGAATTSFAFYGLIDEPRVTAGILAPASFMRAFVLRADLRGLWLANGASGEETFQGASLDYLNGAVEGGVTDGPVGTSGSMRLRALGQRNVSIDKVAVFDGTGALVIPAAAVVGTTNFTVEAYAKGAGEIFRKERCSGNSFGLGVDAEGGAEMAFDTFEPSYAVPEASQRLKRAVAGLGLADGSWHHLAMTFSRTSPNAYSVRLYVDSILVATEDGLALKFDGGDLVLGDGFVGSLCGFRFSPKALSVGEFLRIEPMPGFMILVR